MQGMVQKYISMTALSSNVLPSSSEGPNRLIIQQHMAMESVTTNLPSFRQGRTPNAKSDGRITLSFCHSYIVQNLSMYGTRRYSNSSRGTCAFPRRLQQPMTTSPPSPSRFESCQDHSSSKSITLLSSSIIIIMERIEKINTILSVISALYPKTTNALKVIALLSILKQCISVLVSIYRRLIRPKKNLIARYGRDSWAFVTGSSEGIGKALALQLGRNGFNVIISGRNREKLDSAQSQIERQCGRIKVKSLVVDFSRANEPSYLKERLAQLLDLDVSIVVNNVGVDVLQHYHLLSQEEISKLITINCTATALVSRILLPQIMRRSRKGALINLSSVAGQLPMALHNVYSASKIFVDYLSRSLAYEYPSLDIMSVHPSQVSTPMTHNKPTDLLTILPSDCAKGIIRDLGYERISHGHWSHALQSSIYGLVPQRIFNYVFLHHLGPDFMRQRQAAMARK